MDALGRTAKATVFLLLQYEKRSTLQQGEAGLIPSVKNAQMLERQWVGGVITAIMGNKPGLEL